MTEFQGFSLMKMAIEFRHRMSLNTEGTGYKDLKIVFDID